jgi:serine/threonine protein kinase
MEAGTLRQPAVQARRWCCAAERARTSRHHPAREQVRPLLTETDKLWLVFQLLEAVATMHACGARHGDLKAENVLLTSWNWLLLSDLAPYKPVYVDLENTADFTYFFDTCGRRRCYLAPERFLPSTAAVRRRIVPVRRLLGPAMHASAPSSSQPCFVRRRVVALRLRVHSPAKVVHVHQLESSMTMLSGWFTVSPVQVRQRARDSLVTATMDVFAVGCTIAELLTQDPLFQYSDMVTFVTSGTPSAATEVRGRTLYWAW